MTTATDLDVLIIGGGISGLTTGCYLAQAGLNIQVWEQADRPGGKIATHNQNGFLMEQAASIIMNFRPEVDQFIHQTGMEQYRAERLLHPQSKRYIMHKGQLQALPMTISGLLFSSLWSTSGKLRLLAEPFIGRTSSRFETVSEFIVRRLGKEFLEKAIEPFIAGTLAANPDTASASHVIPRLTALEKQYGSISAGIIAHKILGKRTARNPESFSFKKGMASLPERLARLPAVGFRSSHRVKEVLHKSENNWQVTAETPKGEHSLTARHVIISTPSYHAARLLKPLQNELSQLLKGINYVPLSVVHLGFEQTAVSHPLDSSGFLVPRQAGMNINGNLWMSSVFAGRAPEKQLLLSSYLGGARNPEAVNLSTANSIDRVLADLNTVLGIKQAPVMARIDRHQKALPQYNGNYSQRLSAIKQHLQAFPGLHLQANYIGGVSVRDRICTARRLAHSIIHSLDLLSQQKQPVSFNPQLLETVV